MQRASTCLLTLCLMAYMSSALITRSEQPKIKKALSTPQSNTNNTQRPHGSLVHQSRISSLLSQRNAVDAVTLRPNAGGGPEYVKFGLTTKNFYGANPRTFTFNVDVVMSLEWQDPRVVRLIPSDLEKLSMSLDQALTRVWMPGFVVTNKDIEKYEVISSSVSIFSSGRVLRVERAQVRCLWKFELGDYPFDTQNLKVKIASSKYMLDEVVLVPDNNASGVDETIWGLYDLESWSTGVYNDTDGFLRKSRGYINMEITRQLMKYFDDHLVPSAICLSISCAVFYFPFAAPFIVPRLILSIISLLTFTNLMTKSLKELPGSAPFNFNDLFNQQMQCLMFCSIVLNISAEVFNHQFKKEELSRRMNNHAKVLLPVMSIFNITVVLGGGCFHLISCRSATLFTKTTVFGILACYAAFIGSDIWKEMQQNKAAADAELSDDSYALMSNESGHDAPLAMTSSLSM